MRFKSRESCCPGKAACRLMLLIGVLLLAASAALGEADAALPDSLPLGGAMPQLIPFEGGQTFAVYSGPGQDYGRAAQGKAAVSTNDWIQVFGSESGWIMIQYAIDDDRMRFGWIPEAALPPSASVPALGFSAQSATLLCDAALTDDPLCSRSALAALPKGARVDVLADMSDWAYVESASGDFLRGFVKRDALTLGTVYDLESCPTDGGIPLLRGAVTVDRGTVTFQIEPLLFAGGQPIAVSGCNIYDNLAGKLLLSLSEANGGWAGQGTLNTSTTSLRIVPILTDGEEAGGEWTVVIEW